MWLFSKPKQETKYVSVAAAYGRDESLNAADRDNESRSFYFNEDPRVRDWEECYEKSEPQIDQWEQRAQEAMR